MNGKVTRVFEKNQGVLVEISENKLQVWRLTDKTPIVLIRFVLVGWMTDDPIPKLNEEPPDLKKKTKPYYYHYNECI